MNEWEWNLLEERTTLDRIEIGGTEIRPGSIVILRPRCGGDILDLALAGKRAVIESIEEDYESRIQLAVVLEDDPGRDMGFLKQPGHRFFFKPEEMEPLA